MIHSTAIIEEGAALGKNVKVGPYCHIGPQVCLEDDCIIHPHAVISGNTSIGPGSVVHSFSVIGGAPQHLASKGEHTCLVAGSGTVIREHVTINRGTEEGGGITRIGNNCFFMAGTHVAHDCHIGDNTVFAQGACAGGHARLEDHVFLGALSAVHQRSRIGRFAFVGGCSAVTTDIIPYASVMGNHARLNGLNITGMKRQKIPRNTIHALRSAYKALFYGDGVFSERVGNVREQYAHVEEVLHLTDFITEKSSRPLMMATR